VVVGWRAAEWSALVRAGLRAKDIPLEVAARRVGVPLSTFRGWLDGRHLPRVSIFEYWPALAELAGMSESDLLRAAGLLPDSFGSSLLLARTIRQLRDELDRADRVVRQARSVAGSSSVAQVVGEFASSGVDWEVRLRSANRGRDVRITYHHYVGVVPPAALREWTDAQLRTYIQHEILADIWQPLSLYWRVALAHDWPDAPALVIQVPEQEASRTAIGPAARPDARPIVVLSPPWGYGELLGCLVADAIGFGNIDFRYFGIPEDRPDRTALVQAELDHVGPGFVVSVSPLMMLDGLDVTSARLAGTLPVVVRYGERMRERACQVYRDALVRLAGDVETAMATVDERIRSALPVGTEYLEVRIADEDVTVDGAVRSDRVNDTIAWLALSVASSVLDEWRQPPRPIAGPLRQLVLPSGLVRQPPPMSSRVTRRTVDR
jgi:hypothetical protein